MSNVDPITKYGERLLNLEKEKRRAAEDIKELCEEMRNKGGLTPDQIGGMKLKVRELFETEKRRDSRLAKRDFADQLALAL